MNEDGQDHKATSLARTGYVVIKGMTDEGMRFRPSNWAERLATAVGYCGVDRRLRFHPHVRLAHIDGDKCVVVDALLEDKDPLLFEFLMGFATSNHLRTEHKEPLREVRVG